MNSQVLKEARRLLEEIEREDPVIVKRVIARLGAEGYLIKYLLAKRKAVKVYAQG